ncbi:hypothetical protein [Sphingomonas morindae]|uniref:Transposase n=1 Tax=Sphingomonas morindae TaxID=1541170 RepID=A0ABY4XD93_9SPHN|nr:hypothetical protein [Sphingomonas morindae]USI74942.1 hypothetical protein LHA26_17380 [Sphingomonas morindae]
MLRIEKVREKNLRRGTVLPWNWLEGQLHIDTPPGAFRQQAEHALGIRAIHGVVDLLLQGRGGKLRKRRGVWRATSMRGVLNSHRRSPNPVEWELDARFRCRKPTEMADFGALRAGFGGFLPVQLGQLPHQIGWNVLATRLADQPPLGAVRIGHGALSCLSRSKRRVDDNLKTRRAGKQYTLDG